MGIISIKSTDNLFWLGRYVERVFTTLRVFSEYYDKMIDKDENAYIDFCNKLGIENTYSYKQEFNAVVMRNEISSETLSYIQMAVNYMEQGRESSAPMLKLQEVFDCIFAFWGSADDFVESETTRNILKFGRSVERLDLYTRFSFSPTLIKKEFSILLNRLYKVGVDCNIDAINTLMNIILEKDEYSDYDLYTVRDELSKVFITAPQY